MKNEIENLIKNQLAYIDMMNENSNGISTEGSQKFISELMGFATMGIEVNFNINSCYYINHEPSTYTINEK